MQNENELDVLIIGAGPSGSSAASILAEKGHKVLVLERDTFPRYRIGESLLPFTYEPLERLGLIDRMRESAFVKKYSVQFISPRGKASQPFYFFDRYDKDTVAQTWQIRRAEFDVMLKEKAESHGAKVLHNMTVKELIREDGRVVGVRAAGLDREIKEYRAKITLDCSGKESFAAVRSQWRKKDPFLNKVAVWTYYKGAKRDEGIDAGATTVAMIPEKGWFWYIPQHDDQVSVGVVAEGKYISRDGVKDPKAIFEREMQQNPWVKEHLEAGKQFGDYYITSEYSFHSEYCGEEGLLLVGDAYCFLDPVFSSGLMLALKSGVMAADDVHQGLVEGDLSPSRFENYALALREGIENMRKLIYAFYAPNFSFKQVIEKYPELAGDITDCLSGDVNKDFSKLWAGIKEFAEIPDSLPYGMPKTNPDTKLAA